MYKRIRKTGNRIARNLGGKLFPKCDGKVFSRHRRLTSPERRVKLEFLDAYHRINLEYSKLHALRKAKPRNTDRVAQQTLLLESFIAAKESLDNYYAAHGIAVTPMFRGPIVENVKFLFPPVATEGASLVFRFRVTPAPVGPRKRK